MVLHERRSIEMADMNPVTIPQPPADADLKELHKWATSLSLWLNQNFAAGVQQTFFSNQQISGITGLDQAGKVFFNNDTGEFQCTKVVGGNLSIKTIQTV